MRAESARQSAQHPWDEAVHTGITPCLCAVLSSVPNSALFMVGLIMPTYTLTRAALEQPLSRGDDG